MSESVAVAPCCHDSQPDALLGFVPLQGAPLDRGVPWLDTPPGVASSTASCTFRSSCADCVPKHPDRCGLIRTGLSLTFLLRFTSADGTL